MATNTFADRLKELRGKKEKTIAAAGIGISRPALVNYETGKRKPDIEILEKIANYYNVSADYLIGRTDIKSSDLDIREIAEKTGLTEEAISILSEVKSAIDYHDISMMTAALNLLITQPEEIKPNVLKSIADYIFVNPDMVFNETGDKTYPLHALSLYDSKTNVVMDRIDTEVFNAALLSQITYGLRHIKQNIHAKKTK